MNIYESKTQHQNRATQLLKRAERPWNRLLARYLQQDAAEELRLVTMYDQAIAASKKAPAFKNPIPINPWPDDLKSGDTLTVFFNNEHVMYLIETANATELVATNGTKFSRVA